MRVLHVHSGNIYGGIETLLVTLVRHRDLCPDMQTEFALCFEGRLSKELTEAGAGVYPLPKVRISRPVSVLKARGALGRLLRRERFDVAVCHSAWSQGIFGPVLRAAGLPLVFWLHATTDGRHWLERWARKTEPDLVICNSRFTADRRSMLYPRVSDELVYCPVAAPESNYSNGERAATRAEFDTPDDAVAIIQISRLEKYKGHQVLLEALSILKDIPGWVYWQVGEASRESEKDYLEQLEKTVTRSGISDRVRFLGWQPDARRLLAAADIYCQPNTVAEPFGITFIEALYAGKPVLTTAMGGPKEIVDDSCGLLVPPDDAESLAVCLKELIQDRSLRERMGKAGPARAKKLCDPRTQMQLLDCLLKDVVGQGKPYGRSISRMRVSRARL